MKKRTAVVPVSRALVARASHAVEPVYRYRTSAASQAASRDIGFTGLRISGGRLDEEFHPDLRGTGAMRVYKEMRDNDPIVGAMLFAVTMMIRQAEWKVLPFDDSTDAINKAKLVESMRDDMRETWNDFLSDMLSMLPFGWAFHEVVYKKRNGYTQPGDENSSKFSDGLIGWKSFSLRPQDTLQRWTEDAATGRVVGMEQLTQKGQTALIPFSKGLLFRPSSWKNSPEGRSILRTAYRPWKFKKRFEELEGIGVERDLAGLPMITPKEGLDIWNPNEPAMVLLKQQAEELVRSVRMDEQMGIVLPEGWKFELVTTGGSRAHDVDKIIGRLNNSIAMTAMADFIILGHNNRYGSKALAGNKTAMFQSALNGFLDGTDDVLNNYALPYLYVLNGWDPATCCRFEHKGINMPDIEVLGVFLKNLKTAGFKIFPNPILEKQLLGWSGLNTEGVLLGQEEKLEEPGDGDDEGGDSDNSGSGSTADDESRADSGGDSE